MKTRGWWTSRFCRLGSRSRGPLGRATKVHAAALQAHASLALDAVELAILRLGAYELSRRMEVPYRVVINEGVELAKSFGATDGHKYVNGILDKVAQKLRVLEMKANDKPGG